MLCFYAFNKCNIQISVKKTKKTQIIPKIKENISPDIKENLFFKMII